VEFLNGPKFVHAYCIFPGKYIPSTPLNQVLELVSEHAAIKNFLDFVLGFSFNNDGTGRYSDLAGEGIIADGFEKENVENRVNVHRGWEVELVSVFANLLDYRKRSIILVIEFPRWAVRAKVSSV
jgi:hypothetical protein